MKTHSLLHPAALCTALLLGSPATAADTSGTAIRQIDFSQVRIDDPFWSPRLQRHATATLPVCIDQIERQTPRMTNFARAAQRKGKHQGKVYDDSDVYKALEGIAYSLALKPDAALEQKADQWIDLIASAQLPDGYLNTFYTLTCLDKRWVNMDHHEMYCAGHLTEAAVAYYLATGKRKLLDVAVRMADHMMSVFGPNGRHWVPGHEEIELALVKLYRLTQDKRYLDFAQWLLEERGHGYGSKGGQGTWTPEHVQDLVPVSQLTDISGHAVRCMYLYCGMADVAALTGNKSYLAALDRLWDDIVLRNMYITGGIGSSHHNEGFTTDYDLPNREAYCETCASVGMVLWNHRMAQLTADAKYVDVLERSMYNGALAGTSLAGDLFFYVNPLEADSTIHRLPWYGTACCPSQISRFLPSIGNYIYGESDRALWVNLFIGSTARTTIDGTEVTLTQKTRYPWQSRVELTCTADKPLNRELRVRIPAWCRKYTIEIDGRRQKLRTDKGYAVIPACPVGKKIVLQMDMPVRMEAADPHVKADIGKRAVMRGPLVYCIEETDNRPAFDSLTLSPSTSFSLKPAPDGLDGIEAIEARTAGQTMTMIPYYAWCNRERGKMKVWINLAKSKR